MVSLNRQYCTLNRTAYHLQGGKRLISLGTGTLLSIAAKSTSFPTDLADSLTNSLLNQPLPTLVRQTCSHSTPCEVRSRKENRASVHQGPFISLPAAVSVDGQVHAETRRVSQQIHQPSGSQISTQSVIVNKDDTSSKKNGNSTALLDALSTTNERLSRNAAQTATAVPEEPNQLMSNGSDKRAKRVRNFTPASARVIDEEDEPRRASPRVRLASYVD